jgi:hypothetical protein
MSALHSARDTSSPRVSPEHADTETCGSPILFSDNPLHV